MDTTTITQTTSAAAAAMTDLAAGAADTTIQLADEVIDGAMAFAVPGLALRVAKVMWRRAPWALVVAIAVGGMVWWSRRSGADRGATGEAEMTEMTGIPDEAGQHVRAV